MALAGPGVAEVLLALLHGEDAIIHGPDLAARFAARAVRARRSQHRARDAHALTRFPALRSLALRATSVASLAWLPPLAWLHALDLAATDVADLAPLRHARRLQELDLTLVPATDVSALAALCELRALNLSHVDAAIDAGVLAAMPGLERLGLRGCAQWRGLRDLPSLASLRELDVSETSLAEIPSALPALTALNLSGTGVEDVTGLAALPALRTLMLAGCRVSDIRPLMRLGALEELSLRATAVSDVSPLAHCTALTRLSLAELAPADLGPVADLSALRSLDLHGARITALPSLEGLRELRALDVSGTALSSLEPVRALTGLRELHAQHLAHPVDLAPLLELPPLALLALSRTGMSPELEARLAARHHLVLAGE